MKVQATPKKLEEHFVNRIGWLRAGVLGANDGILSTSSIAIGVASASAERNTIILAALSGLIAGAMSMAAGEYISVSSQSDTTQADMLREKQELEEMPDQELQELTDIYIQRGLTTDLARDVAKQLTVHNALQAHLRDELGITEISVARPLQAAFASFVSFITGAALPLLVSVFAPMKQMIWFQYGFSILFLLLLGTTAAKAGGSPVPKSIMRIAFWGTAAMIASALTGYLFGVSTGI